MCSDGHLSLGELKTALNEDAWVRQMLGLPEPLQGRADGVDVLFAALDGNADGKVSREEFASVFVAASSKPAAEPVSAAHVAVAVDAGALPDAHYSQMGLTKVGSVSWIVTA